MYLTVWGPLDEIGVEEFVDREFGHAIHRAKTPADPLLRIQHPPVAMKPPPAPATNMRTLR
ncbi:hypothetical protein BRD56_01880 [Thermoplasmatales archaeon SW_10_69_26]|nr:MAG: hypothetical protein BRD56_01880 [Thermoplasmatales archaeon SW_10_69_26]